MRGIKAAVAAAGGWVPLAECLGVHPRTVRGWMLEGHMPLKHAKRIKRLYGVRIGGNGYDTGGLGLLDAAVERGYDVRDLEALLGIRRATMRLWMRNGAIPEKWHGKIMRLIGLTSETEYD
jgi:hypothetical protein